LHESKIKKHKIEYVLVSNLRFDPENPRLNGKGANYTQAQIFDILEKSFDILPVAKSMADNGYFDEEPLMVVEKEKEKGIFVVVEGNRRLAALKALIDPAFQRRSPDRHLYENLAKSLSEPLDEVPVMISKSRETLIPRMGFRHIAGIMKWESLSKAVYIHDLITKQGKYDFDAMGHDLIVEPSNIKKNYLAYRIYLQARENEIETKGIEDNFGIWYTALSNVNIQKFIGYNPRAIQKDRIMAPIPKNRIDELAELIGYIFGTPDVKKVIPESRDLKKLGQVLHSKGALNHIRSGGSFADALLLIEGEKDALLKLIGRATLNLNESLSYMYKHKKDPGIAEAILACTNAFLEVLKNFPETKSMFIEELGTDN
jgi:hypothetical protein